MAKSVEQLAGELADREGIRELPLKYCDCVWCNDMTGIIDLFASDGEYHSSATSTRPGGFARWNSMRL